jgi:alpha-N-acetylglucosamine transferase
LITNTAYLTGLLTLDWSLKKNGSKYPLVALYTDTFPPEGHKALDDRGIPKKHVKYLLPKVAKNFTNDPRFYDCWSKLTPFSLVEYDRVVQLDSDMVTLHNMDELMDLELDPPSLAGKGNKVFAASHACVCNPFKKPHYPKNWYIYSSDVSDAIDKIVGSLRIAHLHHSMTSPTKRRYTAPHLTLALVCLMADCRW